MRISEETYTVNKNGGLRIPAAAITKMGLKAGEHVRVAYLTSDGQRNDYREFLLQNAEDDDAESIDGAKISIPAELLANAGISQNQDVKIACLDGLIMICRDTTLTDEELSAVLSGLRLADELTGEIPEDLDITNVASCLKTALDRVTERGKSI